LSLDPDEILSKWNAVNVGAFGGKLPTPQIVIRNTPETGKTTRVGNKTVTEIKLPCGEVQVPTVSINGGPYQLDPDEPVILYMEDRLGDGPEEAIWTTLLHEAGHVQALGDGHGEVWRKTVEDRGITTDTGLAHDGTVAQLSEHQIIPGGTLDRIRQEWLRGARVAAPSAQQRPARSAPAAPSTGRFVAPRMPARQAQTGRQWPASPASARAPSGGRFSPAAPAHASRVTPGAIPKSAKTVFIYADCSGSMYGDGVANMVTALNGIWPIQGAQLFAYSDDVRPASSPNDLVEVSWDMGGGTSFEAIMLHAERHNPDMVLIFSDGQPNDEASTWTVWDRTSFPIGTHYCVNSAFAHAGSVQYMIDLCRGGGEATIGDEPIDIQEGVKRAMTNSGSPRQLPDLRPRIQTGIARIKGKIGVGKRIVELGNEVEDAKFNNAVGRAINAIDGTFDHLAAEVDGLFGQAFDQQRAQSRANAQHWADAAQKLDDGLGKLSGQILGAAKGEIEGTLIAEQQRIAAIAAKPRPDAVRVVAPSINPNLLSRGAAVRAANANGARALPAPSNQRALPAPAAVGTDAPINAVGGQPAQRDRAPATAGRFRRGQ
jgi:hypothetical protein